MILICFNVCLDIKLLDIIKVLSKNCQSTMGFIVRTCLLLLCCCFELANPITIDHTTSSRTSNRIRNRFISCVCTVSWKCALHVRCNQSMLINIGIVNRFPFCLCMETISVCVCERAVHIVIICYEYLFLILSVFHIALSLWLFLSVCLSIFKLHNRGMLYVVADEPNDFDLS